MRKLLVLTLLLLFLTSFVVWFTSYKTDQAVLLDKDMGTGIAQIGGDFTLINQEGQLVHEADFRGKFILVFFGFTHCPDICPVSTATLSKVMELLGDKADQVIPLFITVDPERDTPDVLKEYFYNFDKRIIALTGSPDQIKQVAGEYKTYYARSVPTNVEPEHEHMHSKTNHEEPASENYTVDHSGFIYLMGRDGKYIRLFPYDVSPEELARVIQSTLG